MDRRDLDREIRDLLGRARTGRRIISIEEYEELRGSGAGRAAGHGTDDGEGRDPTLDLVARSVVHELRQPLAVILGYAEILAARGRERPSDNPLWDDGALLERIREAAWRMAVSLEKLEHASELLLLAFGPRSRERFLDLRAEPNGERGDGEGTMT